MYVGIHHTIADPKKWEEATSKIGPMVEEGRLPKGLRAVFYLPSTDGRRADCVWEADSVENLKRFLDPLTVAAARNEYFQIDVEHAFGLPVSKAEGVATH
jgi:hypothetical protein